METSAVGDPEVSPGDGVARTSGNFESFFEAEHPRLFRALYLVTGSAQEAEDVAQEAFLKVWERWGRVAAMQNPTGYLYRTAMNGARSRSRRLRRSLRPGFTSPRPRDLFAEADERDAVARALRGLSTRQRAALVLTEWLGYESDEAGRMLGVTAGTLRAMTHQARATLRRTLEVPDG
jgi:RNA polymerase sigma-70 factor (ECF subfamily)